MGKMQVLVTRHSLVCSAWARIPCFLLNLVSWVPLRWAAVADFLLAGEGCFCLHPEFLRAYGLGGYNVWFEDCSISLFINVAATSAIHRCRVAIGKSSSPKAPFFCRVQSQTPVTTVVPEGIKTGCFGLVRTCQGPAQWPQDARLLVLPTPGLDFFCILAQFIFIVLVQA